MYNIFPNSMEELISKTIVSKSDGSFYVKLKDNNSLSTTHKWMIAYPCKYDSNKQEAYVTENNFSFLVIPEFSIFYKALQVVAKRFVSDFGDFLLGKTRALVYQYARSRFRCLGNKHEFSIETLIQDEQSPFNTIKITFWFGEKESGEYVLVKQSESWKQEQDLFYDNMSCFVESPSLYYPSDSQQGRVGVLINSPEKAYSYLLNRKLMEIAEKSLLAEQLTLQA